MAFIFVPMRLDKAKCVFGKLEVAYFQYEHKRKYTLIVNILK